MSELDQQCLDRMAFEARDARVKATANSLILLEIICELARVSDDPDGYAADLFLRIRARVAEPEEKIPSTLMTEALAAVGQLLSATRTERG